MLLPRTNFDGPALLDQTMQLRPRMTLTFYDHACILRREDNGGYTEYPVDPSAIAVALAAKATFTTGLLSAQTLLVHQTGIKRTVIEYRPPERTAIWLEGSEQAYRLPLPGLIMVRVSGGTNDLSYRIFAVKERPESPDCQLYNAPLPNVGDGGVCWGTVARPDAEALAGVSLAEDWKQFLGSRFGNHTVNGKSRKHPKDLRNLYAELNDKTKYPLGDLVKAKSVMGDLLP